MVLATLWTIITCFCCFLGSGTQGPTTTLGLTSGLSRAAKRGSQTPAPRLPTRPGLPRLCSPLWPEQGILLEAWGCEGYTKEEGDTGLHSPPSGGQLQAILFLGPRVTQCDYSGFCLNAGRWRPQVRASACPLSALAGLTLLPPRLWHSARAVVPSSCLQPGPLLRTPLSSWD